VHYPWLRLSIPPRKLFDKAYVMPAASALVQGALTLWSGSSVRIVSLQVPRVLLLYVTLLLLLQWVSDEPFVHPTVGNEWICNSVGKVLTGEVGRSREETCPNPTFSATSPTLTGLCANPGLREEWQAQTTWAIAELWSFTLLEEVLLSCIRCWLISVVTPL
jgi:hypothetical protein